jgi:hypothetical protein
MLTQDDMMAALDKATKTVIGEAHAFIYISCLYTDSSEYCATSDVEEVMATHCGFTAEGIKSEGLFWYYVADATKR